MSRQGVLSRDMVFPYRNRFGYAWYFLSRQSTSVSQQSFPMGRIPIITMFYVVTIGHGVVSQPGCERSNSALGVRTSGGAARTIEPCVVTDFSHG